MCLIVLSKDFLFLPLLFCCCVRTCTPAHAEITSCVEIFTRSLRPSQQFLPRRVDDEGEGSSSRLLFPSQLQQVLYFYLTGL